MLAILEIAARLLSDSIDADQPAAGLKCGVLKGLVLSGAAAIVGDDQLMVEWKILENAGKFQKTPANYAQWIQ
jgi:hypothetical protein